jgi:septum formation protein
MPDVTAMTITLASASPRRAALLRSVPGVTVNVRPVACDETARAGEVATAYARRIASAKLDAAALELVDEPHPILTADTVVWRPHPPTPIGKPQDRTHAAEILRAIGDGTPHRVTTAFAVRWPDGRIALGEATTAVWMGPLRTEQIDAYLATDEWRDKAGGYGIQGAAAGLVRRIEGSYTNVVGLPLAEVMAVLTTREGLA